MLCVFGLPLLIGGALNEPHGRYCWEAQGLDREAAIGMSLSKPLILGWQRGAGLHSEVGKNDFLLRYGPCFVARALKYAQSPLTDKKKKKNQANPLTAGLHSLSTGFKLGRSKHKLPCSPIQPDAPPPPLFWLCEWRAPSSASLLKPETWEAFQMFPVSLYLVSKASSFFCLAILEIY